MRGQGYILPKSYRRLGLGFFGLAVLVLVFVLYLIWAKVTIILIPDSEEISQELIFNIKESGGLPTLDNNDVVAGKVKLIEVEGGNNFVATGSQSVESDIVGEVTITNNYSKDQALVETTRLAAPDKPDKILVRLKKSVTVPAGQQIKVQVYPDNPAEFQDLKPMKFIIPGLWGPLQEKIYAENSEVLSRGQKASVVTPEDLTQAENKLKDELYQKALAEINNQLEPPQTLWPKLVSIKVKEFNSDVQAGEEVAEFTASMKVEAVVVVFDENQLISLARERLKVNLPPDKQLIGLDQKSFSYTVQDYNLDRGEATIKVSLTGSSRLTNIGDLFDKSKLVGLTEEDIKSYFSQFGNIKSVEVKFQPAWLKKTPRLQEKIEIKIGE